jgi:hypothetical protein
MRRLPAVLLVALTLLPIPGVQAAESVLTLTSSTYDWSAERWTYTYLIDNTFGTDGSVFDVLLEHVDDASIKETPVGWTNNQLVYDFGIDGTVGWYADAPAYEVPVGSTSSFLTGSFIITSPYGPRHIVDLPPIAAYTFNGNETPGGLVDGPTYTAEPSATAVVLMGLGLVGFAAWRRRRLLAPSPCC